MLPLSRATNSASPFCARHPLCLVTRLTEIHLQWSDQSKMEISLQAG